MLRKIVRVVAILFLIGSVVILSFCNLRLFKVGLSASPRKLTLNLAVLDELESVYRLKAIEL